MDMVLKPQDIYVLLKLVALGRESWSYNRLGVYLGMSPSEFLLHGIQYVLIPGRRALTRGTATAHAAPVMRERITADSEPPPVWPYPDGGARGSGSLPRTSRLR